MLCYKSTHPNAKNATVLYDHNIDKGSFWSRDNTTSPLWSCSAPWTQDLQCTVCLHGDQDVYAMCRNLTDKASMAMEAGADPVEISKSDCPTPPPAGDQQWQQAVIIVVIVTVLIIGVWLYRKYCKSRVEQTRNESHDNPQEMMAMTAEAHEENQTPPLLKTPGCCVNGINNGSQQHPAV